MLGNETVHNLASGSKGAQGPGLVLADEARVSGHVGGEDRRQAPLNPLFLLWLHPTYLPLGQSCFGPG
jgi:hypothetical protein